VRQAAQASPHPSVPVVDVGEWGCEQGKTKEDDDYKFSQSGKKKTKKKTKKKNTPQPKPKNLSGSVPHQTWVLGSLICGRDPGTSPVRCQAGAKDGHSTGAAESSPTAVVQLLRLAKRLLQAALWDGFLERAALVRCGRRAKGSNISTQSPQSSSPRNRNTRACGQERAGGRRNGARPGSQAASLVSGLHKHTKATSFPTGLSRQKMVLLLSSPKFQTSPRGFAPPPAPRVLASPFPE